MIYSAWIVAREADALAVRIQAGVYGETAILKAAHAFTDRCYLHLERDGVGDTVCRMRAKSRECDMQVLAGAFLNELLDQALRERLLAQTEAVRRVIIAQAFSGIGLSRPEFDTADHLVDPFDVAQPDRPHS